MAESTNVQNGCVVDYTAVAAIVAGDVIRTTGGLAGVVPCAVDAGRLAGAVVEGIVSLAKTANIVFLAGGDVYWDVSAGKAHFRPESGTPDFYVGVCVEDAAASATTVKVALNKVQRYDIDLERGVNPGDGWTNEATNGLGVTVQGIVEGVYKAEFDAVAEAAQAALYSRHGLPNSAKLIFEGRVAVYDKGDNAALDIDFGLASASHATDFEAIAALVAAHIDGNTLDIKVHSDDGTTDVAPVDSTIDAVDDTFFEVWIDCRNLADVQVYVNGVDAVPAGTTLVLSAAAATAMYPIIMIEKTNDDTVADVRVSRMRVRSQTE